MMDLIKVKRVATVKLDDLEPHPDALACPVGDDDRAALDASIGCVGVLEPLMIVEQGNDYAALIIDGVGRYLSLVYAGETEALCLVVECDDVRKFVAHKNAMGRKRSAGSRVLSYVMSNWDAMLAATDEGQNVHTPWRQGAVAERLKVSRQDVQLAAQLYACVSQSKDEFGEDLQPADAERMRQVFNLVLSAALPIRRWKAAFAGMRHGTQPGVAGKAQADYAELCYRGFKSLCSVWENWKKVPIAKVPEMRDHFRIMIAEAPECMRYEFADAIKCTWSDKERRELIRDLKASLGQ